MVESKMIIICCIFMLLTQEVNAGIFNKEKATTTTTPEPIGWKSQAIGKPQQPPQIPHPTDKSMKKKILKNALGVAITGAAAAGAIAAIKHRKNPN